MPFPIRRPLTAALLGASAIALTSMALPIGPALADPAPPYPILLEQSRATAPRLAEAQAGVGQAQGLARQASARPNPSISLESENFGGSGPFRGLRGAETTASFEQPVELGGKRAARIAAGSAALEAARARAAQAWSDYAADLAIACAEAETADARVQLAAEALALAEDDARVAGALVRAGKEAQVRLVQADAAVQAARANVEEAKVARSAALERLTALSGSPAPFTAPGGGLLAHADRQEAPALPDALKSPAYLTALAERERAGRQVGVERTRGAPDVTVSFGVRRLAGEDATAMVAGVSMPLPVHDRNQGAIAAAQAEQRAAEARLNGVRLDAEADARVAVSRFESSKARLAAARAGESAAAEAYRLTRLGYEAGKLGLTDVLAARRALTDARTQTLNARMDRLSAEIALARLSGAAPFGDL